jgi:hypothetical protein
MRRTSRLVLTLAIAVALAIATGPAVKAGGLKGQSKAGAESYTCKSGKLVRHSKACKENGGKF